MPERGAKRPGLRWGRIVAGALLLNALVLGAGNVYEIASASSATFATPTEVPPAPVAIVLGNMVFPGGGVSPDLRGRLDLSLALYKLGKVKTIFVSGASRAADHYDEAATMAAWLVKRGVAEKDIVQDPEGYRTAATMADAAAAGFRDAIVCTQAYHLPRALFLARRAGIRATGVPAIHHTANWFDHVHPVLREGVARPESVLEVALLGVRGRAVAAPALAPKS
jgi:SanA protein